MKTKIHVTGISGDHALIHWVSFLQLAPHFLLSDALENPEPPMKHLQKITLMMVTTVYAGYLIQQAARTRTERLFRLAAGESPFERTHPKPRGAKKS